MDRAETLQRVKDAEAKAAAMKRDAEAERDRILKDLRRTELELQDSLRKQAEAEYDRVLAQAKLVISKEREAIIENGKKEAEAVKAKGMEGFEKAVKWLVEKFKGALNA